jgi:hypothetical protein
MKAAVCFKAADSPVLRHDIQRPLLQDPHAETAQLRTQRIDHAGRLVGLRKHAVPALRFQRAAVRFKPRHDLTWRKCVNCAVEKARIARYVREKVLRRAVVRHVAAALSGYVELFAQPVVPFQQRDLRAVFCGRNGRHHPGGAAADDKYAVIPPVHRRHTHPKGVPDS